MLTFLRRIRKSLIDSGSARKYLLYAIGEIILVMIGILLALQVNNWNQNRIEKQQTKALLKSTQITIRASLESLRREKRTLNEWIIQGNQALKILEEKDNINNEERELLDSALANRFKIGVLSMNTSSLEKLSSTLSTQETNLQLLRATHLAIDKIDMHSKLHMSIMEFFFDKDDFLNTDIIQTNSEGQFNYEFKKLKKDGNAFNFLSTSNLFRKGRLTVYDIVIELYQNLIQEIEAVIKHI